MGRAMLFMVTGLIIIAGMIQVAVNNRTSTLPQRTTDYYYEQQARNVSISLVDNAIERLKNNNEWTGEVITDNAHLGTGRLTSYDMNSQEYPDNISVGAWDEYKVLLVSRSEYEGYVIETEVLMQRDSFSKYSYFSNSELSASGGNIFFYTGDELTGPIHTNGTYKMSGTPTFNGLVTSPNNWEAHYSNPTNPNFYGGTNFNAPLKTIPTSTQLDIIKTNATNGGLKFANDIEVNFYVSGGEGYINIREYEGSWGNWNTYQVSDYNGIISTDGRADVLGNVKGQITLHAETLIEIDGDLRYNTNPLDDSTSTDLLGLISEGDVRIDVSAHLYEGTQDIDIHASIMALNNSFYVEDYTDGSFRGNINLVGGIIQNNRGSVGTFGGYYGTTGFSKNYTYDSRLRGTIPPQFPREKVFSILYWKDKIVQTPN